MYKRQTHDIKLADYEEISSDFITKSFSKILYTSVLTYKNLVGIVNKRYGKKLDAVLFEEFEDKDFIQKAAKMFKAFDRVINTKENFELFYYFVKVLKTEGDN